ncbi:MAG: IscS subfamily cysteine desulfurase [Anaerolineaceae bacterium]|nr:IscS subfamily cysteine desulfurase [Anaerolineaceae bacterium]
MRIYADNAATTKMSRSAIDAMLPYLEEVYGNPSSIHSIGQQAAEALTEARQRAADILHCSPREITFTSGGSEADNQALRSAAALGARTGKTHIVSTSFEHHAVLHTLDALKREGFEVTLLDIPENGVIEAEQVSDAIRPETCLVSVMYANNEIGTVQPIMEIGRICREKGVPFHSDTVQAFGHLPLNLQEMPIDMLSLSAHKFHGPKGAGLLYCRRGIPLTPVIYGGAQERGKRAGTENLAAIMGMAAAMEESSAAMNKSNPYVSALRDRLIEGLSAIPRSVLNGDREKRLPGNVNFCFEGIEGEALLLMLDKRGIAASSGSACTSGSLDPSHVLLAIGRSYELALGSLRLTINEDNTAEEIEEIIRAVSESVKLLRDMAGF